MHWMTTCAGCSRELRVHDDHKGHFLQCPRCSSPVAVRPPTAPTAINLDWLWRLRWPAGVVSIFVFCFLLGSSQTMRRLSERGDRFGANVIRGPSSTNFGPVLAGPGGVAVGRPVPGGPGPAQRVEEVTLNITSSRPDPLLFDATRAEPALIAAGKIAPFISLAGDPETGTLLTAGEDDSLRCYSSRFAQVGVYRLGQPAYQMVLDPGRGRLYAATAPRSTLALSQLGDREYGLGKIQIYDVRDVLQGKPIAGELRPIHSRQVDGHILGLFLSSDRRFLCYLAESSREVHLARLALDDLDAPAEATHSLRTGGSSLIAQAPDGTLFALSGHQLVRFDPVTGTLTRLLSVSGSVQGMTMTANNRIVLTARGGPTLPLHILLVEPSSTPRILGRYSVPTQGRAYLRSLGQRLYLGSSAVLDGQIRAFTLSDSDPEQNRQLGKATSGPKRLLRGGLHLTPDGRHVLSGNGHIFATPAG